MLWSCEVAILACWDNLLECEHLLLLMELLLLLLLYLLLHDYLVEVRVVLKEYLMLLQQLRYRYGPRETEHLLDLKHLLLAVLSRLAIGRGSCLLLRKCCLLSLSDWLLLLLILILIH